MDELLETPAGTVPVVVDDAGADTALILAHGAGAGMNHPFLREVALGLSSRGVTVIRFNFVYMGSGRKAPDRQPVLEATFETVVREVQRVLQPQRLFIGGKSMGGRIASHLPARDVTCDGLVFLGYPLHPPGRPDRMRDQHLLELTTPMLFVEGTRDPFCPLDTLTRVTSGLRASAEVVVIEDGDHSFRVRKSSGRDSQAAMSEVIEAVFSWVQRL